MNYMLNEIESLPNLLEQIFNPLDEACRRTLNPGLCQTLQRIYVAGCGDSHHAALATEFAFENLTLLPVEPMTAMQFARYTAGIIPPINPQTSLVIGISVSGGVSRTVEALRMATQAGAVTVALTANPQGELASNAQLMLDVPVVPSPVPDGLVIPGVRSYLTSQVTLVLIAVRIAEVRGTLSPDQAKAARAEIRGLSQTLAQTIRDCAQPAMEMVRETMDAREFVYAGSGPNFGTALSSAAKMLEASGDPAVGQDMEEWAHLQYFAREKTTPTILITAGDRDLSRAEEVAVAAKTIGRRLWVAAPASSEKLIQTAEGHFPLPEVKEMLSPLPAAVPGELIAAYRAEALGETYFRAFGGGRSIEGGGGISRIRTSQIWEEWKP